MYTLPHVVQLCAQQLTFDQGIRDGKESNCTHARGREVDATLAGLVRVAGGAVGVLALDAVDLHVQRPRRVVVGQGVRDGNPVAASVAHVQFERHRVASWVLEVGEAEAVVAAMTNITLEVARSRADHFGDRGVVDAAALVGAGEPLLVRVEAFLAVGFDVLLAVDTGGVRVLHPLK